MNDHPPAGKRILGSGPFNLQEILDYKEKKKQAEANGTKPPPFPKSTIVPLLGSRRQNFISIHTKPKQCNLRSRNINNTMNSDDSSDSDNPPPLIQRHVTDSEDSDSDSSPPPLQQTRKNRSDDSDDSDHDDSDNPPPLITRKDSDLSSDDDDDSMPQLLSRDKYIHGDDSSDSDSTPPPPLVTRHNDTSESSDDGGISDGIIREKDFESKSKEEDDDDNDVPKLIPRKNESSSDSDSDLDDDESNVKQMQLSTKSNSTAKRRKKKKKRNQKGQRNVETEEEKIKRLRMEMAHQFYFELCTKLDLPIDDDLDSRFNLSRLSTSDRSIEDIIASLFDVEDKENNNQEESKIKQSMKNQTLWSLIGDKYTSQIIHSLINRPNNNAGIVEQLKSNSNELLDDMCKGSRKDDLLGILDLGGVNITSDRLVDIFKILPSSKGDQFNNKIASTIINKCEISVKNKSDLKIIGNVINDRVGKQSKKKLLELARESEKKQNSTKKAGAKKEVFIDISSSTKKAETRKSTVPMISPRKENMKAKVKDTFKSKFEKRIAEALPYYYKLLDEYKLNRGKIETIHQKDEVKEEERQSVEISTTSTKRLSSKDVVEALTRFQECSHEEQKVQEANVMDLEMNMDLSDFNHESEWTIEMAEEAHKWFRKHMKRQNDFCQRVVRRLKILSTGRWPYVLCKSLKTKKTNAQLYESKIDSGSRILWEVAVSFSPRRSSPGNPIYEQVIRVWDIVDDHDKLSDRINLAIDRIAQSCKRGEESCIHSELILGENESLTTQEGIAVPRVFTAKHCVQQKSNTAKAVTKPVGDQKHYPPASHDPTQYTLLKFYQLNNDAVKLLLDSNDDQIDLPFTPGPKEHEIIHHKSDPKRSMLLQGRSGTGKTTCLVFRMWAQYMAYADNMKGRQPKQLFITKNGVLRNEVEKSFGNMGLAYRKRFDDDDHDYKNDSFYEEKEGDTEPETDGRFPLFVTSSEWLDVLDKELPGKCFFTQKEIEIRSQSRNLIGDAIERGMQAILRVKNGEEKIENIRREMDFRTFRKFWPKINARQKTELDPAMVWREIYTYIKGSILALKLDDEDRDPYANRYLSFDEYLALPRKQSRLNPEQRSTVFELYLIYEKIKKENHYYDAMDVVYNLAGRAKDFSTRNQAQDRNKNSLLPIDSVFIDEVQDFTMTELYLVTKLSTDQNNLMLAGDTAQSITEGVAFRFTDVRQIFFELFGGQTPDLLSLEHNYRSHSGILRLAACTVELLYFFFGDSLDKLPPDLGLFEGPKPIIMEMTSTEELALMLQGERENSRIEFGAHQVVIVRNESVKDSLVGEFDIDREWIMTVQESKGLEFDDVLLYNFFTESEAGDHWRVVSNYTEKDVEEYYSQQSVQTSGVARYEWDDLIKPGRHLEFSHEMHKVLETEMKILYTAITRARVNMFIVETNAELSSPMFTYFKQRKVVEEVSKESKEGISNIPVFGKMSSEEDWRKQGEAYLRQASGLGYGEKVNQRLRLAAKCFEKAGDLKRQKNALAYLKYVEELDNLTEKKDDIRKFPQKRERFYGVATELLEAEDVNFLDKAGFCLFRSGDIEKARSASIFELYGRISYAKRDKESNLAPDIVEQRNFIYAAELYEELSMDETESLVFQRKHLVNAIRNYLSEGTKKGWTKVAELINSNLDFLKPVSKDIKDMSMPSAAMNQDPLSYVHQQLKIPGKADYLMNSLSKL